MPAPRVLVALFVLLIATVAAATTSAQESTTPCPPVSDAPADATGTTQVTTPADCTPEPTPPPPPTAPQPQPPPAKTPAAGPPMTRAPEQQPLCAEGSDDGRCYCPDGSRRRLRGDETAEELNDRALARLQCAQARQRRTRSRSKRQRARSRRIAEERRQVTRRQAEARRRLELASSQKLVPITGLRGRPLPEPLPPGKRLTPDFARLLERVAREEGADWALVLAVLREEGKSGSAPAGERALRVLAGRLSGRGRRGERVRALAAFHHVVGLAGLTKGLNPIKRKLARRVLRSRRIHLYWGGRGDVEAGRIDVRVLTVLLYLARRHHQVDVSSLISGHSLFTKAGGVSLHAFGRAADIRAVDGKPILGNQQPGGITERALRSVLLLPQQLQPSELISLFSLGGPSFALSDHADHIHVGFESGQIRLGPASQA